jgi:hypothetical protein
VRENGVVPPGLAHIFPLHPALPCRAFTYRRFAAGFVLAADVGRGSNNLLHGACSNSALTTHNSDGRRIPGGWSRASAGGRPKAAVPTKGLATRPLDSIIL